MFTRDLQADQIIKLRKLTILNKLNGERITRTVSGNRIENNTQTEHLSRQVVLTVNRRNEICIIVCVIRFRNETKTKKSGEKCQKRECFDENGVGESK